MNKTDVIFTIFTPNNINTPIKLQLLSKMSRILTEITLKSK